MNYLSTKSCFVRKKLLTSCMKAFYAGKESLDLILSPKQAYQASFDRIDVDVQRTATKRKEPTESRMS